MDRRTEILEGKLHFPVQIMELMKADEEQKMLIEEFWSNIWHNFLREGTSDTITWMTKFNDAKFFNKLLMWLSHGQWIESTVDKTYASIRFNEKKLLKWITSEELRQVRHTFRFMKYRLGKSYAYSNDIVQNNGKYERTGLIREGFRKAGNNIFSYDIDYINEYAEEIAVQLKKGLVNSTKDITYQEIISELTNYYGKEERDYTLGNCLIDTRGRAIFNCSKKVLNPVGSKVARSLLTLPDKYCHELTEDGLKAVYAFITELSGHKAKTYDEKVQFGEIAYHFRSLPEVEDRMSNIPARGKLTVDYHFENLDTRIWLERIYQNLDSYVKGETGWYIPIEIDATASVLQFMGVLLNNHEYMSRTNLIHNEDGFKDVWTVPYIGRDHVKKVMVPYLYGSGKQANVLLSQANLTYTIDQLNKLNEDLRYGLFSSANNFKDFIINNVKPEDTNNVSIFGEEFTVECNRFMWEVTTLKTYDVYTSNQGNTKRVTRKVSLSYDLKRFKRYFVTLLIHHLDSRVADRICNTIDWILPNHDSFTIHPNSAFHTRKVYIRSLYEIYENRKDILRQYFDSIGITRDYPEEKNHELSYEDFSIYCLK